MLDDLAFLEVIRQSPADDGPRLIYADYLEEKGDPAGLARAEFIRLQCLLAGGPRPEQAERARERERALLDLYWRAWMRPVCQALGEPVPVGPVPGTDHKVLRGERRSFEDTARRERYFLKRVSDRGPWPHAVEQYWGNGRDIPYLHSAQFRRGFVSHVTLAAKNYRNAMHVARLLERTPLEGLAFVGCTPAQFSAVLQDVDLSHLRTLELIFTDPEVVRLAARCPALAKLERLIVRHTHGTDDVCQALAAGRELGGLKHLLARSCHVTDRGMEELAALSYVPNLQSVGFPDCTGLTSRGLQSLAERATWDTLHSILVSGRELAALSFLTRWQDRVVYDGDDGDWPELYDFPLRAGE